MAEDRIVTIDGKRYKMSSLAGDAEKQLNNVRGADMEIMNLQRQTAIAQTARSAYARALQEQLKNISPIGDAVGGDENTTLAS